MDASYYLLETSTSSTSSLVLDEKKTKEVLNKIVLESVNKIVNVSNHIISEKNSFDSSKNDFGGLKILAVSIFGGVLIIILFLAGFYSIRKSKFFKVILLEQIYSVSRI
jgi:hypothetical protein